MGTSHKYIVVNAEKDAEGKIKNADVYEAFEAPVPNAEFSKWKMIWRILTDKTFCYRLDNTVKYALRHHEVYRGSGAADVRFFNMLHVSKIFDLSKGRTENRKG